MLLLKFRTLQLTLFGNLVVLGNQYGQYSYNWGWGNVTYTGSSHKLPILISLMADGSNGVYQITMAQFPDELNLKYLDMGAGGQFYAAGTIDVHLDDFQFSGGPTFNSTGSGGSSAAIMLRFTDLGIMEAAHMPTSSEDSSTGDILVDKSGSVWVSIRQKTTSPFSYGSTNLTGPHSGTNAAILKYDSSDWSNPQGRIIQSATDNTFTYNLANGPGSDVYMRIDYYGAYSLSANLAVPAPNSDNSSIVRFNESLVPIGYHSQVSGGRSRFQDIEYSSAGFLYLPSYQYSTLDFSYTGGVNFTAPALNKNNSVLLKLPE
jgi:hypothetical protein